MNSRFFLILLIVCASSTNLYAQFPFAAPTPPPGYPTDAQVPPSEPLKKAGQYIFRLSEQTNSIVKQQTVQKYGYFSDNLFSKELSSTLGFRKATVVSRDGYFVASGIRGKKLKKFKKAARKSQISKPEKNYKVFSFAKNDFFYSFGLLWGLDNVGFLGVGGGNDVDIDAPEAWEITEGSSDLVVAVIDTGTYLTHPDLKDNIFINPLETLNGIDDDGNGFIDDISGWDFHNEDNEPNDDHFHGTHVSGTIAAVGNNGRGVIGVAPNVKILPLKVLGGSGEGDTANLIRAVEYAVGLKERGINVAVLNASLGGGEEQQAMKDALSKANKAGITFVAAAGNDGTDNDAEAVYPASYQLPNVIAVASVNSNGDLSSFSNYGRNKVHVAAPGENIWSSIVFNLYLPSAGTSMACPHVAGVAALVKSKYPSITPSQVRDRIMNSVKPLASLKGKIAAPGIVSARNALK